MFSEGNAAHPVVCDSPLHLAMAVWHTFFELLGWLLQPAVDYNGCLSSFKIYKKYVEGPLLFAGCHT
jgi:hypothetical protein